MNLKDFINAFLKNNGQYVFISLLVTKICAFVGSVMMIRILPEEEFGILSIVASVFAVFAPFSGLGSTQSLLRFGSTYESEEEKKKLSHYLFIKGFINQIILSLIFILFSVVYLHKYEQIFIIFLFFGIRLLGFYFLLHIQSEKRIHYNNKDFARISNAVNISGLIMMLLFSYYWGILGYLIANAVAPFISLFWFKKDNTKLSNFKIKKKEIWSFAIYASFTAFLSDAFFSADILLLSFLKNESLVANYKIAILLPSNITFLALAFMQSDYPVLAKNYKDKKFLKNYIINYYKIFIPICILICVVGFFTSSWLLTIFFGEQYSSHSHLFIIFLIAFCGSMLLRNLYGNLLAAVGKIKINTFNCLVCLCLLIGFTMWLVPNGGLKEMVIAMSASLTLGGLVFMFSFLNYLRKLK